MQEALNHSYRAFGEVVRPLGKAFPFVKCPETIADIGIKVLGKKQWITPYIHLKIMGAVCIFSRYAELKTNFKYKDKKKIGWGGKVNNFLAPAVGISVFVNGGLIRHIRVLNKLGYLSKQNILVRLADHNRIGKLSELVGAGMAVTCSLALALEKHREAQQKGGGARSKERAAYDRNMRLLDSVGKACEFLSGLAAYFGYTSKNLMNYPKWFGRVLAAPLAAGIKVWNKTA